MNNKIICKYANSELILDCSKLELNLYRILKLLNEVHLLPVLFPEKNPPDKSQKNQSTEPQSTKQNVQTKKSYQHQLSVTEAMNLIWYSANLCKSRAIVPYQTNKMMKNKLVGEENQLKEIIQSMEIKIKDIAKIATEQSNQVKQARVKLSRIKQLQKIVGEKWAKLKTVEKIQLPLNPKNINLSFLSEEVSSEHKQLLLRIARKSLLQWDIKILQQSIMFVQQVETGHCIVSLQQCYPSFMVYKELLKCLIGQYHYNKGVKQMLLCKEQGFKQGKPFIPSKHVMCHLCKQIALFQQVQKSSTVKICGNMPEQPTVYASSYAFDQLILKCNYHRLPLKPLPETEIKQCYQQTKDYQKYVHPYVKVYYPKCSRYFCEPCLSKINALKKEEKLKNQHSNQSKQKEMNQSQQKADSCVKVEEGKSQVSPNSESNPCIFCTDSCGCDRCSTVYNFKKLLAFYKSFGGSFQDLAPELMFLNFYCTRVHIQLVTFEREFYREEENPDENRVELDKADEESLSYPEQVSKLEGWFAKLRDKQRIKLYGEGSVYNYGNEDCESVDQNQIFPQLQEMFDKLLKQQQEKEEQPQVKILEEQERRSVRSRKSKGPKLEQYFSDQED